MAWDSKEFDLGANVEDQAVIAWCLHHFPRKREQAATLLLKLLPTPTPALLAEMLRGQNGVRRQAEGSCSRSMSVRQSRSQGSRGAHMCMGS